MNTIPENPPKADWPELMKRPGINSADLTGTIGDIIARVQAEGDDAVKNYSLQFHGFAPALLWVTPEEIAEAHRQVPKHLRKSIEQAKKNIEKFHKHQVAKIKKVETASGVSCWRKTVPVQKVGLYIPGGSAPLFSTLLMLAVPAKLAGCKSILVTTPANKSGNVDPAILYAAQILGIESIYKGGGAQAIAAMAYGTQTVEKVDKIFGPGNQYVTAAKRWVSMDGIAIDMLAGPSELAVYADESCVPAYVAADLLSQAEHGPDSQVVLVAANRQLVERVIAEIHLQLPDLPRKEIIEQSFLHRRFLVIGNEKEAFEFLNAYAPEHLLIASERAGELADRVVNAGSVFLGNYSPESAGDYASGTNHSLPTNGTALTQSGVSVDSFVKKITFQELTRKGLKNIGRSIEHMATAEGLMAHKNAVSIRLKK